MMRQPTPRRADMPVEVLRELVNLDLATGALFWARRDRKWFKTERDCNAWNTRYAGCPAFVTKHAEGYLIGQILGRNYFGHRVSFALANGHWPDGQVDHENGRRTENAPTNLRNVTHRQNGINQKRPAHNSSGEIGVSWHKKNQMWRAYIKVHGRQITIGYFHDFDAAVAARRAASEAHGFHPNHGRCS